MKLLKLWWHCLWHTLKVWEDHRMCWEWRMYDDVNHMNEKWRYCTCGYKP